MEAYLDNAASTRISEKAYAAMSEAMRECYGNPSSAHGKGFAALGEVEKARNIIGVCLGCDPARIIFTSGATEANNLALQCYAEEGERRGKKHIVVSAIEHPSVMKYCEMLRERRGFYLSVVKPRESGVISVEDVEKAICAETAVVCVMAVNNETGVIQPFEAIHKLCTSIGVPYHCDATQAIGHIPFYARMEGASISFSAHKFHGAKGVGALVWPDGWRYTATMIGGDQEDHRRAGTENVCGIIGMAVALSEQNANDGYCVQIAERKNQLWTGLCDRVGGVVLNGNLNKTVPHILNVSFEGVQGDVLVSMLSEVYGVYCSTGSACCSGNTEPSRVLKSMGLSDDRALSAVRFSMSKFTNEKEIDYCVRSVHECVNRLRKRIQIS